MADRIPDYIEPILAYRIWVVKPDVHLEPKPLAEDAKLGISIRMLKDYDVLTPFEGVTTYRLCSRGETEWPPYEALEGRHLPPYSLIAPLDQCSGTPCDGHIPHHAPKCGIYGVKRASYLVSELLREIRMGGAPGCPIVVGVVALWGRIVEHEHGYRAQFAYPKHVEWGYRCDPREVARTYGIPYQEEHVWRLVFRSDESWPSRYKAPSHAAMAIRYMNMAPAMMPNPRAFLSQMLAPEPPPPPTWSSRYLHNPNSLSLVKKPRRRIHQQPSFQIHRPIGWWFDQRTGLWLRTEAEKDEE